MKITNKNILEGRDFRNYLVQNCKKWENSHVSTHYLWISLGSSLRWSSMWDCSQVLRVSLLLCVFLAASIFQSISRAREMTGQSRHPLMLCKWIGWRVKEIQRGGTEWGKSEPSARLTFMGTMKLPGLFAAIFWSSVWWGYDSHRWGWGRHHFCG